MKWNILIHRLLDYPVTRCWIIHFNPSSKFPSKASRGMFAW